MFEAALEADPAHPVALTRYADLCYSLYPPHTPPTRTPVDSRAAEGADGQSASSRLAPPPPHTHMSPAPDAGLHLRRTHRSRLRCVGVMDDAKSPPRGNRRARVGGAGCGDGGAWPAGLSGRAAEERHGPHRERQLPMRCSRAGSRAPT